MKPVVLHPYLFLALVGYALAVTLFYIAALLAIIRRAGRRSSSTRPTPRRGCRGCRVIMAARRVIMAARRVIVTGRVK